MRRVLGVMGGLALGAVIGCHEGPATPENLHEPQAVVLTVAEAPEWARAGAEVEVRDEHDALLLRSALEGAPPVLVDLTAPPDVRRLTVALHFEGHEAVGEASVQEGYATCRLR
jgi:hypothetical protein